MSDARTATEGQRRQVTVLFADIADFMPLAERLGEEGSYELVRKVAAEMMEAVQRLGGTVQDFTGDGIMALFGAPAAMEDAPIRACRAALDIQARMRALERELEATHGARPKVRIGIHAGPLIVGEVGDGLGAQLTAIGDTVNLAARLQTAAEAGGICISSALHSLVENQIKCTDAGDHILKGKSVPQHIYHLHSLSAATSRFDVSRRRGLSDFVARSGELELLNQCWERSRSGGVQVAHVVGEAGIGKSRLLHEFRQRFPDDVAVVLQGDCRSDGAASALLPFIEVVRAAFRISATDDRTAIERKLEEEMVQLGLAPTDLLPYLMALLGQRSDHSAFYGQGADLIGIRTRAVLLDLLWQRCRTAPVVLIIEDLHWIDAASEQLLQRIVESSDVASLLLICTFRPQYKPTWSERANVSEANLQPLSRDAVAQLLMNRLDTREAAGELVRLAAEKSEGNPLFAEEIANYLQRHRVGDGALFTAFTGTVLPATLQNLIMDHFDRLDVSARSVLQVAAVVGRKFPTTLVSQVANIGDSFGDCVAELEFQEWLFPIDEPHADFAFKHALVQESIYDTLMSGERRRLHAAVAAAFERLYAGRTDEVADTLAHHFEQAGDSAKAIRYLTVDGRKNLQVFSLEAADYRFTRAAELMEVDPDRVDRTLIAEFLSMWLEVQEWRAEFGRLIEIAEPRLSLVKPLGDNSHVACIISLLGAACSHVARFEDSKRYLRIALEMAERCADDEAIARACLAHMNLYNLLFGEMPSDNVPKLTERVFPLADRLGNLYFWTYCNFFLAWNNAIRGNLDVTDRLGARSAELGRRQGYAGAVGYGLLVRAFADTYSERFDVAIRHADEGAASSGGLLDRLCSLATKGLALVLSGQVATGAELLADVERQIKARKFLTLATVIDVPIGVAKIMRGEMADGVRWLELFTARMQQWGTQHAAATGHLVLGEVYLEMLTGNEKPSLPVVLRNLAFLLRSLPFAATKALKHLERAVSIGEVAGMHGIVAQALFDIGRVHKARRRLPQARQALEQAEGVAATIEWQFIRDRISTELRIIEKLAA